MKKLVFSVAIVLFLSTTAMTAVVSVDLTLDTPTSTVNTMESTITLSGTLVGLTEGEVGVATESSELTTAVGEFSKINLGFEYNYYTKDIIGISSIEFIRQENVGPIVIADTDFSITFPNTAVIPANFIGMGGNMDTAPEEGESSTVAGGIFPGPEQRMYIDKGIFRMNFGAPVDWDFSLPGYAASNVMTDDCEVSVALASSDGRDSTFDVAVEVPLDFVQPILDFELNVIGEFSAEGTMKWSGQVTHTAPLVGDANDDGFVDGTDAETLAENWLTGPGATWEQGDFNFDGFVNDVDATIMAASWSPSGTAVPEPSTVVALLSLLLGGLVLFRRR